MTVSTDDRRTNPTSTSARASAAGTPQRDRLSRSPAKLAATQGPRGAKKPSDLVCFSHLRWDFVL